MTGASIGLCFKADWEIWSNPVPRVALQAFEADVCEIVVSPELLPYLQLSNLVDLLSK